MTTPTLTPVSSLERSISVADQLQSWIDEGKYIVLYSGISGFEVTGFFHKCQKQSYSPQQISDFLRSCEVIYIDTGCYDELFEWKSILIKAKYLCECNLSSSIGESKKVLNKKRLIFESTRSTAPSFAWPATASSAEEKKSS
jgi:hypothetical protein